MILPLKIYNVPVKPALFNALLIILFTGIHLFEHFVPSLKLSSLLTGESVRLGYWTFTRTLVHADLTHLALNILYLYFFGNLVCRAIGNVGFVSIGLISWVLISLIDVGMKEIVIGAGGIVSAYMGSALAAYPFRRVKFLYLFGFSNGTFSVALLWVVAFLTLVDVKGLINYSTGSYHYDNVAYWDHILGLLIGFAITYAALRDKMFTRKDKDEPSFFNLISSPQSARPRLSRTEQNRRIVDTWVVFIILSTFLGLFAIYLTSHTHSVDERSQNYLLIQFALPIVISLVEISIYWKEKLFVYSVAILAVIFAYFDYFYNWYLWHQLAPLLVLLWLMQASNERAFWPAKFWFKYENSLNAEVETH